jgi:hypothetical protein
MLDRLALLRGKRADDRKPSALYADILTMKEFGINPEQWRRLSKVERRVLYWWRVAQEYFFEFSPERIKMRQQQEKQRLDGLRNKMPRVKPVRRR